MDSTVLFDDVSISDLKSLSAEELLIECLNAFESLDLKPSSIPFNRIDLPAMKRDTSLIKDKIKGNLQHLQLYLGEIYRRNILGVFQYIKMINDFLEYKCFFCNEKKIEYHINHLSELICSPCNSKYVGKHIYLKSIQCEGLISKILCDDDLTLKQRDVYDKLYHISLPNYGTIQMFKDKLQEIRMVKETMLRIIKTPLLKALETCMDEILDLNGNRISQLKEYLTEDQYRFVRSGTKFDELDEQQDILERMNKMLNELKRCAVGESILEPIAYAVLVPPAIQHLKNELISNDNIYRYNIDYSILLINFDYLLILI